jgi:N-methylhydantoinase A
VTDANVALGYMNPRAIAGSSLRINRDAALAAIEQKLAEPLQLATLDVAYGISLVANSAMTRVLRAVSTERGRDPRDFTLAAFGGAGPIHAAALAESMEITKIVVPIYPGLFSALGLLMADYRHDYVTSIAAPLASVQPAEILDHFATLQDTARTEMEGEGIIASAIRYERFVDLKYGYQMYEMTLPFTPGVRPAEMIARLSELFTNAHQQAYGYHRDDPIDLVSLRLRALSSTGTIKFQDLAEKLRRIEPRRESIDEHRDAYFGPKFGSLKTPIGHRLDIEGPRRGPMIINDNRGTRYYDRGSAQLDGYP